MAEGQKVSFRSRADIPRWWQGVRVPTTVILDGDDTGYGGRSATGEPLGYVNSRIWGLEPHWQKPLGSKRS
jgi:hypothetical protein